MARLAIRMPKMSMTMTEGEVAGWLVQVGDVVEVGDVVAEVMTDKIDMEVETSVAGTLVEITHDSGMVAVGEPIGWVEGEDEGGGFGDILTAATDPEPALAAEPEPEPVAEVRTETAPEPPTRTQQVAAVPRARSLARQEGVDLASVSGSGPDGLIRVPDVQAATQAAPATPVPATPAPATSTPAPTARPAAKAPSDRRAAVRAVIARALTPSAAIPQFTVWREVELDAADAARQGVSWTTVLLQAYAAALREVPELLGRWEGDGIVQTGAPVVALAVATDRGLLVPALTEPDLTGARDLDEELRAVVASAKQGRVEPKYLAPANASLSNLGGLGVDRFQALLTPPQASVLSLGSIRPRPVAVPGGLGVALTVEAGLTVDHRVVDGAEAARLLEAFADRLRQPLQ